MDEDSDGTVPGEPDLIIMTEYGAEDGGPMSVLSVHRRTGELYLNGSKIVTEKRFSNYERGLAVWGLSIAAIGSLSAVILAVLEIGRSFWGLT